MAVKKPKRGSPGIDMTAMVDVAFLLLTFFILTTTRFREETKVEVDTPSSVSNLELPDNGMCVISIDPDGRVFVGFTDIKTREAVLERFIKEQEVEIAQEGAQYFSTLQEFGVHHDQLEEWLNGTSEYSLDEYPNEGVSPIVTDSSTMTGNELKDWIRWGRLADQKMRFAIKGDTDASYEQVAHVISSLQDWNVNQFSLITEMESGGLVEVVD